MKRLTAYPALREPLDQLQPKVFALSSDADATPVKVHASELGVASELAVERIKKSKFTSKGDKDKVISLYEEYARSKSRCHARIDASPVSTGIGGSCVPSVESS